MMFRLVVKKNGKRTKVVEIRTPTTRIGRAHGNEIRIPSAQVSRQHCRLQMKDGLVMVEDLGSVNGTLLNESLLTGAAVVRPGDLLGVGPVTFVVEYELTPKALKRLDEMEFEIAEDVVADDVELAEEAVEEDEVLDVVAAEEEITQAEPEEKPSRRPTKVEEVFEVDAAVEEEYVPKAGLEEISWARPEDGDLRDVLSLLDEGLESLQPKKRPGPRKPSDKSGKKKTELEE
jgi:pSer/pThr/pTyr-binding forkhead associated (FHA) protein